MNKTNSNLGIRKEKNGRLKTASIWTYLLGDHFENKKKLEDLINDYSLKKKKSNGKNINVYFINIHNYFFTYTYCYIFISISCDLLKS